MTMPSIPETLAYNVDGAGQAIGTNGATIRRLIRERKLTAHKVRGRTVILADDLRAYLAQTPTCSSPGAREAA